MAIKQAKEILGRRFPELNFQDYHISAWKNSCSLEVRFRRKIRFIPLNCTESNFQYDIIVDLFQEHIHPFDSFGSESVYIPSAHERKKIEFVLKSLGFPVKDFFLVIAEGKDLFNVTVKTDQSYSRYFLNKLTGEETTKPLVGSFTVPVTLPSTDPFIEITV